MDSSTIVPISGENFEDFLLLTNQEQKSKNKNKHGRYCVNKFKHIQLDSKKIDLNRIFVDTVRMELLIFPVVEHWKRPLTNAEWEHINRDSKHLEKQMEQMKKCLHYSVKKIHVYFLKSLHYSIKCLISTEN